jgi:UPF0755 protein
MRENVMQKVKIFFSIILTLFILGLFHFGWLYYEEVGDNASRRIEVKIPPGATLNDVQTMLVDKGLLDHAAVFRWAAFLSRKETKIQAGRYLFRYGESVATMLGKLAAGEVDYACVVIPEGLMLQEIAALMAEQAEIDSAGFMEASHDSALIAELGFEVVSLEGYLFPDTYLFSWPLTPRDAIERMVHRFYEVYKMHVRSHADTIGFSMHEVVTLASIIQAEAVYDSEMPHISAVYHNRLQKRWRLEADPTVAYALGGVRRKLWYKDLRVTSPYNTYRVRGLPPGPICSPGKAALIAAARPIGNNHDLYFVADGTGRHIFSETLRDHNRAKEFIKNGGIRGAIQAEENVDAVQQEATVEQDSEVLSEKE